MPCLFCTNGCQFCNPYSAPDWFNTGPSAVETHKQHIKMGLHPLGARLYEPNDGEKRCENCRHLLKKSRSRVWYKCALSPKQTGGPGTDVKLKWWACEKWEGDS
jgi:hypothetical protein